MGRDEPELANTLTRYFQADPAAAGCAETPFDLLRPEPDGFLHLFRNSDGRELYLVVDSKGDPLSLGIRQLTQRQRHGLAEMLHAGKAKWKV